tara:strand:- start:359 stop:748 length:390 start_codon:yes stop_codon:yes gene_type:complete
MKNTNVKTSSIKTGLAAALMILSLGQASAGVYSSEQAITSQQYQYNKQQVLSLVDSAEVQQKLMNLGVSPADAKLRIASMTNNELQAFNQQMNEAPAGGIIGTIVTVLVVVAVLDLMGITDVYPFIRPI